MGFKKLFNNLIELNNENKNLNKFILYEDNNIYDYIFIDAISYTYYTQTINRYYRNMIIISEYDFDAVFIKNNNNLVEQKLQKMLFNFVSCRDLLLYLIKKLNNENINYIYSIVKDYICKNNNSKDKENNIILFLLIVLVNMINYMIKDNYLEYYHEYTQSKIIEYIDSIYNKYGNNNTIIYILFDGISTISKINKQINRRLAFFIKKTIYENYKKSNPIQESNIIKKIKDFIINKDNNKYNIENKDNKKIFDLINDVTKDNNIIDNDIIINDDIEDDIDEDNELNKTNIINKQNRVQLVSNIIKYYNELNNKNIIAKRSNIFGETDHEIFYYINNIDDNKKILIVTIDSDILLLSTITQINKNINITVMINNFESKYNDYKKTILINELNNNIKKINNNIKIINKDDKIKNINEKIENINKKYLIKDHYYFNINNLINYLNDEIKKTCEKYNVNNYNNSLLDILFILCLNANDIIPNNYLFGNIYYVIILYIKFIKYTNDIEHNYYVFINKNNSLNIDNFNKFILFLSSNYIDNKNNKRTFSNEIIILLNKLIKFIDIKEDNVNIDYFLTMNNNNKDPDNIQDIRNKDNFLKFYYYYNKILLSKDIVYNINNNHYSINKNYNNIIDNIKNNNINNINNIKYNRIYKNILILRNSNTHIDYKNIIKTINNINKINDINNIDKFNILFNDNIYMFAHNNIIYYNNISKKLDDIYHIQRTTDGEKYYFNIKLNTKNRYVINNNNEDDIIINYLQSVNYIFDLYINNKLTNKIFYYKYKYIPTMKMINEYIKNNEIKNYNYNITKNINDILINKDEDENIKNKYRIKKLYVLYKLKLIKNDLYNKIRVNNNNKINKNLSNLEYIDLVSNDLLYSIYENFENSIYYDPEIDTIDILDKIKNIEDLIKDDNKYNEYIKNIDKINLDGKKIPKFINKNKL